MYLFWKETMDIVVVLGGAADPWGGGQAGQQAAPV